LRGTAPVRNSQRQHWQAVRMTRMLRHGHSSLQPVAIACTEDSALPPHVCGVKAQEGTISPRQVARKRTRGLECGAASNATHPPSCPAARHAAPTTDTRAQTRAFAHRPRTLCWHKHFVASRSATAAPSNRHRMRGKSRGLFPYAAAACDGGTRVPHAAMLQPRSRAPAPTRSFVPLAHAHPPRPCVRPRCIIARAGAGAYRSRAAAPSRPSSRLLGSVSGRTRQP
jgi:hypothetical protein